MDILRNLKAWRRFRRRGKKPSEFKKYLDWMVMHGCMRDYYYYEGNLVDWLVGHGYSESVKDLNGIWNKLIKITDRYRYDTFMLVYPTCKSKWLVQFDGYVSRYFPVWKVYDLVFRMDRGELVLKEFGL